MPTSLDELEFTRADLAAITAVMVELSSTAAGGGWVTIDPAIRQEHTPPTESPFGRIFGNRGPWVPRATWVPADTERRTPEPTSIGVLHAAGPKAVQRLAERDIAVPDRWQIVGDHPKRGMVAHVPIDVDHSEVVTWLLDAVEALTKVPLLPTFRATIHRRT